MACPWLATSFRSLTDHLFLKSGILLFRVSDTFPFLFDFVFG